MLTEQMRAEAARLKRQNNAIVLAHYYVQPEAQDLADFVGDSYGLSRQAATMDCDAIVFAGVEFMAESAKLLSPHKHVYMPEPTADCPMAHMMSPDAVERMRQRYDDLAVACYVNSTTQMKALSDVCVTSSNAVRIVSRLPQKNVFFIPDVHLGHYVAQQVPQKNVILNDGFCPTHEAIELREVEELMGQYPEAVVCAHPECAQWILDVAGYVGSTSGIIKRCVQGDEKDYIVCTVHGVLHQIEHQLAQTGQTHKRIHFPRTTPICPNMARVTGQKVLDCLRDRTGEVQVDPHWADGARRALERMLELAK